MVSSYRRRLRIFALALALTLAAPAAAADAQLLIGVQDDPVFVRLPSSYGGIGTRGEISASLGYQRMAQLGASVLRIAVNWAAVEPRSHSREEWSRYDAAIAHATRAGLSVQLVLAGPAPAFATANHRIGNYRPSDSAFAHFVEAAVRRYKGEVATYSIWNEPNWWSSLKPNPVAPMLYRGLYRAGYTAVKRVDPSAHVLIGELASIGYPGAAIAPLRFLRELLCRTSTLRPWGKCSPLLADGFAVHPYTLRWPPSYPGKGGNDVTTGSISRLVRLLAALAKLHALSTPDGQAPPVYLTEYGWSPKYFSELRRATMASTALGIVSRQPQVKEIVWYQLAAPPAHRPALWDTALLNRRGQITPIFTALRAWITSAAAASAHASAGGASSGR